jgi:DNA-binding PadR family transcriptional regulator
MNQEIKPLELLFLWRLAVAGGSDWLKDIKPNPEAPARKRLESYGVIEQEKRKPPSGGRAASFVSLTDMGWGWLGDHLDADLRTRTPAGTEVLYRLLLRLKTFTEQKQLSLGDLILPSKTEDAVGVDDLENRVTKAYLSLSGGQTNVRVRLADLRRHLSSIPRVRLDQALLDMASGARVSLYRLDDPKEIHAEDRDAVLHTPSGEERHIVYLGGRGS